MATGICTEIDHSTGQIIWLSPQKTTLPRGNYLWLMLLFISGMITAPVFARFADLTMMIFSAPILMSAALLPPFYKTLRAAGYSDKERSEVNRRALHSVVRFAAYSLVSLSAGWLLSLGIFRLIF